LGNEFYWWLFETWQGKEFGVPMMQSLVIPMQTPAGEWVEFKEILARVLDNNWKWICLEFDGVGLAPKGMSMGDFESEAVGSPRGYRFSWRDLKDFAAQVEQVHNCLFVAMPSIQKIYELDRSLDEFPMGPISIRGFDNSDWEIGLSNEFSEFQQLSDSFVNFRT
jgi:hypothetical protein